MSKQYCTAAEKYEFNAMVLDFKTIKGICDYGHKEGMSDDSIGQAIAICNEFVYHKQKQPSGIAETLETIKGIGDNIISFKKLKAEFREFREGLKSRGVASDEAEENLWTAVDKAELSLNRINEKSIGTLADVEKRLNAVVDKIRNPAPAYKTKEIRLYDPVPAVKRPTIMTDDEKDFYGIAADVPENCYHQ